MYGFYFALPAKVLRIQSIVETTFYKEKCDSILFEVR